MLSITRWTKAEVVRWFERRFRKVDSDKAYFEEWVERFRSGWAWALMDKESRKVWLKMTFGCGRSRLVKKEGLK